MPLPSQTIPRFEQIDEGIRHARKRERSSGITPSSECSTRHSMETLNQQNRFVERVRAEERTSRSRPSPSTRIALVGNSIGAGEVGESCDPRDS
jgi:hypothetical protein